MNKIIAFILVIISLVFATENIQAANYALEIIAPRPSLNTLNRYYKAYPGIEYNVKVGVFGGLFPFVYSLTTAPSGMVINADTGVISWPNPTTSGSPHTVTARVVDSESTATTVTWTVTVTTTGFYFLDATNGNDSNAGTLASPWKTIGGMYLTSKYDSTYVGGFLYFRTGTYLTKGTGMYFENSSRLPLSSGTKPIVWMGYPGETATIDTQLAHVSIYSGSLNTYFDNLRIINMRPINGCETDHGLAVESGDDNFVFRRLTFYNQATGTPGCNDSSLMIMNGGTKTNYMLFSENTIDTGDQAYGLLAYSTNKVVCELNTIRNWSGGDSHILGAKTNNTYWSIRKNTAVENIGSVAGVIDINTYSTTNNFDISFNNVKTTGEALTMGSENTNYRPIYSYRNTYQGSINIMNYSSGIISFVQDIIINSNNPKISYSGGASPTQTNLLTGVSGDNIVDSSGLLLGTYRTTYLGTRGWELASGGGDETAPSVTITTIDGSANQSSTYATSSSTVTLAGTVYDAVGVVTNGVTWVNSAGGSGTATCANCDGTAGTKDWSQSGITLQSGENIITIYGADAVPNTGTDVLTVTYETTPPTVTSASVNGATATINFSETVVTTGYDTGDFNLDCTSPTLTDVSLSSPSGSGSSRTFTIATPIVYGQTCNLDYIGTAGDITDSAGNNMVAVNNISVTNNTPNPADLTPPVCIINNPTTNTTWPTSSATITVGGSATDGVGVTSISWACPTCTPASGVATCVGCTGQSVTWSQLVALTSGANVFTATATDGVNTHSDAITITYTPGVGPAEHSPSDVRGVTLRGVKR